MHKLLLDFEIQTDHLISARQSDLVKAKKNKKKNNKKQKKNKKKKKKVKKEKQRKREPSEMI